jgi:geranylgeranyl diphosphate synthase, type I
MTAMDSFASYSALIRDEVAKAVSSMPHTHAEPMRDQVTTIEKDGAEAFLAALLCLATAEAAGGTAEEALPSATAIALVDVMVVGFTDLSRMPVPSLETRWGLARSLNAGDGFFAQAQRSLLSDRSTSAERAMAATTAFDAMCARFSQALYQAPPAGSNGTSDASLFEGGAVLGGLAAAADPTTLEALRRFGVAVASGLELEEALEDLPAEMRPQLEAAAQFIIRRRSR